MIEARGITGNYALRAELIEITRRLAPEKLSSVLESLSPGGLNDLINSYPVGEVERVPSQQPSKGKQLLEQALSIFK